MRLLLIDPASFTPQYDHELASSLVRAGVDVELVTSRFRFGDSPAPGGYTRSEIFYPVSNRLFKRSSARLPLKAAEHPVGLIRIRSRPGQIVHHQWLAAPKIDNRVLRMHRPSVFTAHDLLPRRTATKRDLWRTLLQRFTRVIVHSEHGRETLADLGVDPVRLRVIPHPVFASEPARQDDGATVLALGVIRPYKRLADTIAAVAQVPEARLLVVGDPLEPVDAYRAAAGPQRNGGSATPVRPTSTARSAKQRSPSSRTTPRSTRAGHSCARSGQASPLSRTTSVGSPSRCAGSRPAASSSRETSRRWRRRSASCSPTRRPWSARVQARAARGETLTWDAAAAAHVSLYEELL